MKLKNCMAAFLAVLLLCPACRGAEATEYLFRLCPGEYVPDAVIREAEPICEERGVYAIEDGDLIRTLDRQGKLLYCEENGPVQLMDYSGDVETLSHENWPQAILGADYAMEQGNGGEGTRIGMIDSGISVDFSDYSDAVIVPGTNYCAPEEAAEEETGLREDTSDSVGHGTFVASLLASREVGICPKAELVPLKCFEEKDGGNIGSIASAIYDAVDVYHCDVINMSLGVGEDYETLRDAVSYAYGKGVILVAACGNLSAKTTGNDPLFYPAAYDQVISVGSLNSLKRLAAHSSRNSSVWVVAPGENVLGLTMPLGRFLAGMGTSYSAPFVTAAAALARSARQDLTPVEFMVLLAKTAEDLGQTGRDNAFGYGMLNLGLLLAAVTKDTETMIPSYFNNTLCLSLWRSPPKNCLTWLARYEEDGRFRSLEELTDGRLNNLQVSGDAPELLLLGVDRDTGAPLYPAVRYGGAVDLETDE